MDENLIANIEIELYMRNFLADSIRNIPISTDVIRHESAKDSLIRKAMN